MKRKFLGISFAVIMLFVSSGTAQKAQLAEIKRVDSYVKKLAAYIEKPSVKLEIYADVSTTKKPKWKKFRSKKSLEKFRETNEVYDIGFVWRRSGKIVAANFTFTSESGDWAHYVFHSFRPNGTLAKVEADLRTFYGYMSVQRTFYYNTSGKLILKRTKYRDIETNKPKKPGDSFYDNEVSIYKTTHRLPFLL